MKRLMATAVAAFAAAVVGAADMASQKWVEMKLDELRAQIATNAEVRALIASGVSNEVSVIVGPSVAEAVSNSLAITKAISPMAVDAGTNGMIYATFIPASEPALYVTNSLNAVITNGFIFAYKGGGIYTNAAANAAITCTTSNFVWSAVGSEVVDGMDTFVGDNGFSVLGTYLTPMDASEITGGEDNE